MKPLYLQTTLSTNIPTFGIEQFKAEIQSCGTGVLNLVRKFLQETREWQEQIGTIANEKYGSPFPKSSIESQVAEIQEFFQNGKIKKTS